MKKQYSKMSVEFQPMRLDTSVSSVCSVTMQYKAETFDNGHDACSFWYDPFFEANVWLNERACDFVSVCTNVPTAGDYIFQS